MPRRITQTPDTMEAVWSWHRPSAGAGLVIDLARPTISWSSAPSPRPNHSAGDQLPKVPTLVARQLPLRVRAAQAEKEDATPPGPKP